MPHHLRMPMNCAKIKNIGKDCVLRKAVSDLRSDLRDQNNMEMEIRAVKEGKTPALLKKR